MRQIDPFGMTVEIVMIIILIYLRRIYLMTSDVKP